MFGEFEFASQLRLFLEGSASSTSESLASIGLQEWLLSLGGARAGEYRDAT